jgi:predicted nucleic acid-binding protein
MPTGSSGPDLLVDTSVAVALLVGDHVHHESTSRAVGARRLGLAGHAAFETFSVLTRLPSPVRRVPRVVAELIGANFPDTRFLSAAHAGRLVAELASAGLGGGAIYDALVGATAREHGVRLATRDRRATETYRVLGVEIEIVS